MSDQQQVPDVVNELENAFSTLETQVETLGKNLGDLAIDIERLSELKLVNPETEVLNDRDEAKDEAEYADEGKEGVEYADEGKEEVKEYEEEKGGDGEYGISGGTFESDEGVHEQLVDMLVDAVPEARGSGIGGAYESSTLEGRVLAKVGATGCAMRGGLSEMERLVEERMQNVVELRSLMAKLFDNLKKAVDSNTDKTSPLAARSDVISSVHKSIDEEFANQLKSLSSLLKVKVKPAKGDLLKLVKDNRAFTRLVEKLGDRYGTPKASDRLAMAFTNLSQLQQASRQVKDALSTLKMTTKDYKKMKSASAARRELNNILNDIPKKNIADVTRIMKAMDILKANQYQHDKIVKCLDGKCGAVEGGAVGGDLDTGIGRVVRDKAKTPLKSRIKTYESAVKEIFKAFVDQLYDNVKETALAVDEISVQMGDAIEYDDNMRSLVDTFDLLRDDLDNKRLYYGLIGLDQTVAGREIRVRFTSTLKQLISILTNFKSNKSFAAIHRSLTEVMSTIDTFTQTISDFRSSEGEVKLGRQDFTWSDKLVDPTLPANVSRSLKESITKIRFFGNLSVFKKNLQNVHLEHKKMEEGYAELVGRSIGEKLADLEREYTENVDRLNDKERGRGWLLEQYNKRVADNQKIPKELVETVYRIQHEAKKGLYQTVEALDLYLMQFTKELSGNIEALRDLDAMLKQSELISRWYNTTSGEAFREVVDLIQEDNLHLLDRRAAYHCDVQPILRARAMLTGASIREALEKSKKAVESVAVLKNLVSLFTHVGDKFGSASLSSKNYMSATTIYKNLIKYIWVSGITMGHGTGGGNADAPIDSPKKNKGGYDKETGDIEYFFSARMPLVFAESSILGEFRHLLDEKINSLEAKAVEIRPRVQADYAALNNAGMTALRARVEANLARFLGDMATVRTFVRVSVAAAPIGAPDALIMSQEHALDMWHSAQVLKKELKTKDIFATEDKYFILAIKAIAGKVLTVVESSRLLEQPRLVTSMISTPVRTILGAGSMDVKPDAVELYIRLPLLAEFYRSVFEDGNLEYKRNIHKDDDSETIAFIPEIGSVWSGLIQEIFDGSRQAGDGFYSEDSVRVIVSEINKIYAKYSHLSKQKLTRTVISDFIAEINRRYGIMKRKDINDFYQVREKYRNNMDSINSNDVDYDILGDDEFKTSEAPSSKFSTEFASKEESRNKTTSNDLKLVKDFRNKIHRAFYGFNMRAVDNGRTLNMHIKYLESEVSRAETNDARMAIIARAIDHTGSNGLQNSDIAVLFHEMVRYPIYLNAKLYVSFIQSAIYILRCRVSFILDSVVERLAEPARSRYIALISLANGLLIHCESDKDANAGKLADDAGVQRQSLWAMLPASASATSLVNNDRTNALIAANRTVNAIGRSLPFFGTYVDVIQAAAAGATNDIVGNVSMATAILKKIMVDTLQGDDPPNSEMEKIITELGEAIKGLNIVAGNSFENVEQSVILSTAKELGVRVANMTSLKFAVDINDLFANMMVKIRISPDNKMSLDYSKLKSTVENNIETIKMAVSKFRTHVPKIYLDTADKQISALESLFLNKFIQAQDSSYRGIHAILNMDSIGQMCTRNFSELAESEPASSLYDNATKLFMYGDNLSIRNDAMTAVDIAAGTPGGAYMGQPVANYVRLSDIVANDRLASDVFSTNINRVWTRYDEIGERYDNPADILLNKWIWQESPTDLQEHNTVLRFNNLLVNMLRSVYDGTSHKFYAPLVKNLRASQSAAVDSGNGIVDIFRFTDDELDVIATSYNILKDAFPDSGNVLMNSVAFAIRALTSREVYRQPNLKYHAVDKASDLPLSLLEKMRTCLPTYRMLFKNMLNSAKTQKAILDNTSAAKVNNGAIAFTNLSTLATMSRNTHSIFTDSDANDYVFSGNMVRDGANMHGKVSMLLGGVVDACQSVVDDITETLASIDYGVQFFEHKPNFIKSFFNANDKLPTMPPSVVTAYNDPGRLELPGVSPGSAFNSWLRGVSPALLMGSKQALWLDSAVKSHNISTTAASNVDDKLKTKFSHEAFDLASVLFEHDYSIRMLIPAIIFRPLTFRGGVDLNTPRTFFNQAGSDFSSAVQLVSDSNTDAYKLQVVRFAANGAVIAPVDRQGARIVNLLDLNVSPINVHALAKEIPGIHLYNYAFTFDSMVRADIENIGEPIGTLGAREVLAMSLIDPYFASSKIGGPRYVGVDRLPDYGENAVTASGLLYRTLRTATPPRDNRMGFQRSKYLADQVSEYANTHTKLNAKLVRNIIFVANVHRYVLNKIKTEVERVNRGVIKSNAVVNRRITTLDAADAVNDDEFAYVAI